MAAFIQGDGGYMTTCNGSDRISPKSSWEIRCGKLITSCECVKRNGLQNECNVPSCVNKNKKLYEISNDPKSARNEIQIKPAAILPQDTSPRMNYGGQFPPQQTNDLHYQEREILGPVHQISPQQQYPSQYQASQPQHLQPNTKSPRTEINERQDRMIDALVARRNAIHEKEIICPEQYPENLLDCNPLQDLNPSSKRYAQVQRSYYNSPNQLNQQYNPVNPPNQQYNPANSPHQPNQQYNPANSPHQHNQQYNMINSPNQQYNPVNPYNPQQQYILSHYEPGGNTFPHHCDQVPQRSDPNQAISQYMSHPPNEMRSPRVATGSIPNQYTPAQPVQYQLQTCCIHGTPKPCCNPPPCCDPLVTGNLSPPQSYMPHQHQPTNNNNIPHQHHHFPTNNANIPYYPQNLQPENIVPIQNQPDSNPQYANYGQMEPTDPICNCNQSSHKAFTQNITHDYEHRPSSEQNPPVDLIGNQYGQSQVEEFIQPKSRSYVEPLVPEPQELSEYPPQIRRIRLDGKECQ